VATAQILVVEDERIVAEDIKRQLEKIGYGVTAIASSAKEAISKAEQMKPDLVLMDIVLEGQRSGIEAAGRIRSRFNIPVIYLTAYTDEALLELAKQTEPFGYIVKPFEAKELKSNIEMALYKRQVEEKLRRSEGRYRDLVEKVKDIIYTLDTQGNITSVNYAVKALGYQPEELIGKNFVDITSKEMREKTSRDIDDLLKTGEITAETELLDKKGKPHFVEYNSTVVKENDRVVGTRGIIRDITERKRAELALRDSRTTFHNIVEKSTDGVVVVDREGKVRFANQAATILFGRKTEETLDQFFGFPIVAGETTEVDIIREQGRMGVGEMRVVETQWEGKPADLVLLRDITQHKNMLAELDRTRQQQLQMKNQFLSNVSHELRSPLTVINQFVTILLDGLAGDLSPEQREYLEIAHRNTNQLRAMIDELLEATRAETGSLTVELQQVSLAELVPETIETLQTTASAKGITLSADLSSDLPPAYADPYRVQQILRNLIENGIKFISERGTITVQAQLYNEDPDFLCVAVADTGRGISTEETKRIFDYLYQAKNGFESGRKGLGLGLYICKELVSRHGGRIWVKSRLGHGSTFFFTLPIFSLEKLLSPILTPENLLKFSIAVISARIQTANKSKLTKTSEVVLRETRAIVQRCILPNLDVLLPTMAPREWGEILLVVACCDRRGAEVLMRRIEEQLAHFKDLQTSGLVPVISFTMLDTPPMRDGRSLEQSQKAVSRSIEDLINGILQKEGFK